MKSILIFAFVVAIQLLGCNDHGASSAVTPSPSSISFNHTAYDFLGAVTATGTLIYLTNG